MAVARLRDHGYTTKWEEQGFDLCGPVTRNHKEESYNLGVEACYVKHCGSVRPAYVLEASRHGEVQELMHIYIPMGLERQHELQSSILGRFRSHELAACFLSVATTELMVGYRAEACTCVLPDEASKHGTATTILTSWQALIEAQQLQPAYAMHCEQGKCHRTWLERCLHGCRGLRWERVSRSNKYNWSGFAEASG